MSQKFPPTREDGSFCVVVKFQTIQNAAYLRDQVTEWCNQWVEDNNALSRKEVVYDDDGNEIQPFDYFYAFTAPPYLIKSEGNELWLRFDGVPGSYWWRDWLVRMIVDLTQAFPELQHEDRVYYNCDE